MLRDEYDLTDDELSYLHGKCDEYAITHFQPGDKIIALVEYDYDIEQPALLHTVLFRNNKYWDIRGNASSIDEILEDFDYGDFQEFVFNNIDDFKNFLINLEKNNIELDIDI